MPPPGSREWSVRLADVAVLALIISVLAALTLPAILRVRESSNRMKCGDNIKCIAIAVHTYHTEHNRFPPGWLGPEPDAADASQSPNVGLLVELLPFLRNEDLYKQLCYQRDFQARTNPPTHPLSREPYDPPSNVPWWKMSDPKSGVSNLEQARTRIDFFLCPSDHTYASKVGTIVGLHIYPPDAPANFLKPTILTYAEHPDARDLGRTNYFGVAGCIGTVTREQRDRGTLTGTFGSLGGVFGNRIRMTFNSITDGSSNTLLIGESCGGTAGPGERERAYAFSWFVGALPTYHGLPRGPHVPWYAFSSTHPAMVNFAWCDGSVRAYRRGRSAEIYGDDWWHLQWRAGCSDGGY